MADPLEATMADPLNDHALDQLFREARTLRTWLPAPVSRATLAAVADLMKLGPTESNCCPARIVFVVSQEAKARLKPHLASGNVDKTMSAPATAIIGTDSRFHEKMDVLQPHQEGAAEKMAKRKPEALERMAFRGSSMQGAYLIMAARTLGLDCGPMSGFDRAGVDGEFFPDGRVTANFLCNLGYGDRSELRPRLPRLEFQDFCTIA